MSATFDLTAEPWIPVAFLNGGRGELGLRDAMVRAHEIRALATTEPPVTIALFRLLLALAHRLFGPRDRAQWRELHQAGRFDEGLIDGYLQNWRSRFDLFDAKHPFFQSPNLDIEKTGRTANKLVMGRAAGNNDTLFDHSIDDDTGTLSAGAAARWLVVAQAMSPGGLFAKDGGGPDAGVPQAPILGAVLIVPCGATLHETLLLNMAIYPTATDSADDRPAWEAGPLRQSSERPPLGLLDYLTWQSRRIGLHAASSGAGFVVDKAAVVRGDVLPNDWPQYEFERQVPYQARAKGPVPYAPLRFTSGRALWRDSTVLLQHAAGGIGRPKILQWLEELLDSGALPVGRVILLDAYGVRNNKAKLVLWRQERLALPSRCLEPEGAEMLGVVEAALGFASDSASALKDVSKHLRDLLAPAPPKIPVTTVLDMEADFWPVLERPFRQLIVEIAAADSGDPDVAWRCAQEDWVQAVRSAAHAGFRGVSDSLYPSGRHFEAVVRAESKLHSQLHRLQIAYLGENEDATVEA